MAEQFTNQASSTLNGAITSGATSLVVASSANFPTSGNFRILVDAEIMVVTAVSTNTFTVTRAQEGTTAAAHATGVPVTHIVTAGGLSQTVLDNRSGLRYGVVWSAVEILTNLSVPTFRATNQTSGTLFMVTAPVTVNGVLTYWAGTSSQTLKGSLWDNAGGTRLASGTLAVSAAGVYYIPFTSAYTVGTAELHKTLASTVWETSGTNYTAGTQTNVSNFPAVGTEKFYSGGPFFNWIGWTAWVAGDANPTNSASGEAYLTEPVFQLLSTTTTTTYTQPAYGSTVSVTVTSATNMLQGQVIYVTTGGFYKILAISTNTLTLLNVADSTTGAAAGTIILAGASVQLH